MSFCLRWNQQIGTIFANRKYLAGLEAEKWEKTRIVTGRVLADTHTLGKRREKDRKKTGKRREKDTNKTKNDGKKDRKNTLKRLSWTVTGRVLADTHAGQPDRAKTPEESEINFVPGMYRFWNEHCSFNDNGSYLVAGASGAWQINSVHCPYQGTPNPLWTTPLMTAWWKNENIWKEKEEERQKGVKACITAHLAGLPDRGGKR